MRWTRCCLATVAAALLQPVAAEGELKVKFEVANLDGGSTGSFTVLVHPDWAPVGAQRFSELVKQNFFSDIRFFRVISGFMAQFGIAGDPAAAAKWKNANIKDDPSKETNARGRVTFATAGPGTRTTQMFINFKDNSFLDTQGFPPFGEIVEGMEVVDTLYKGYGEGFPQGHGPDQGKVQSGGNAYLNRDFPKLSYIVKAELVSGQAPDAPAAQQKFEALPAVETKPLSEGSASSMSAFLLLGLVVFVVGGFAFWMMRGSKATDGRSSDFEPRDLEGEELTSPGSAAPGQRKRPGQGIPE
mmetsp:Transcript_151764/g.486950  ORF Transcript_151764/g.486950 Transcript_151764/m.486950 type:complete len:300 (+) Transcript_151764:93-992(+)